MVAIPVPLKRRWFSLSFARALPGNPACFLSSFSKANFFFLLHSCQLFFLSPCFYLPWQATSPFPVHPISKHGLLPTTFMAAIPLLLHVPSSFFQKKRGPPISRRNAKKKASSPSSPGAALTKRGLQYDLQNLGSILSCFLKLFFLIIFYSF